jgi:type III secretion system YscI/HrpB-like protein
MEPRSIQSATISRFEAAAAPTRTTSFGAALAAAPRPVAPGVASETLRAAGPVQPLPSAIAEPLRALRADERALESAMVAAEHGRGGDADDLLALQATVYRYSLRVELATRVIDRAAQGVRHLVNMQV